MRSPYGLDVISRCAECRFVETRLFSDLTSPAFGELESIKSTAVYPARALLFLEGERPRGIYIVCSGRVKLSVASDGGKTVIVRIAEPGEILGISAVLTGEPYEVTAETLDPGQVAHIERNDFLGFLNAHGDVAIRIAHALSMELRTTFEHFRLMVLSGGSGAKLARLILLWCRAEGVEDGAGMRVSMTLTHEEIAQAIDSSRETVTRLLATLRGRGLIDIRGSSLIVPSVRALESYIRS